MQIGFKLNEDVFKLADFAKNVSFKRVMLRFVCHGELVGEGSVTARFSVRDFEIQWISGGFLDFSLFGFLDFWISKWISGFQSGFLDFMNHIPLSLYANRIQCHRQFTAT